MKKEFPSDMIVSGFTFVRNGFKYGYPVLESIGSLLPIVDEFVVVIGNSDDGTREAVASLGDPRIRIIDTIWDENLRTGGRIFAQQADIGMDHARRDADWLFHLQVDEVIHEKDHALLRGAMEENLYHPGVEGLLLRFLNFYGDYRHYCPSRRFHQWEVRVVRNDPQIRSYRDSMGFRRFPDLAGGSDKGIKLAVKAVDATVFHYSWVRPPKKLVEKQIEMGKKYNETDDFVEPYRQRHGEEFQFRDYDYLAVFRGTHPAVMQDVISRQDWEFHYDPSRGKMSLKEKFLRLLHRLTGRHFFIYKNYRLLRRGERENPVK